MSHRSVAILLFILSLVLIPIGYFLLHPDLIRLCPKNLDANCLSQSISFGVGKPLFWSTWLLPPLFFVLIFVKREVFNAWWKVILPISILALYLIIVSPPLQDFLTPGRTQVTSIMVKLIVISSLVVIAWKYWRLSRVSKTKSAGRG
jgi:hypothetical protein